MAPKNATVADWIKRYLAEEEPRSKSLIVSAFGDSIAPLAPGMWLGELIELMAPFGISERLVRTSAFRLVDEGWLEARRDGRRSYYALTDGGTRRFEAAYGRIYTPPPQAWDGNWTVVLVPRNGETSSERSELRKELEWEGFAAAAPGVLLHPAANAASLQQILKDQKVSDRAVILKATALDPFTNEPVKTLISRYWDLAEVDNLYASFVSRFQPLLAKLDGSAVPPQQAFIVQTLLIHSFRRATLHDPRLPTPLLPAEWHGLEAYQLTREIYQRTYQGAQAHLASVMQEAGTAKPTALGQHVKERFGGLK